MLWKMQDGRAGSLTSVYLSDRLDPVLWKSGGQGAQSWSYILPAGTVTGSGTQSAL